jgi:hypothetical protein
MTVNLSSLLFRVRATVADISVANMDDLAMYREIQKADRFIERVKRSTVADADLEIPIVCLAAYYAHANYTLLNVRQLGTIDEAALIRQNDLKKIAKAQVFLISDTDINEDLGIDDARYQKMRGIGFAPTTGIMSDMRW